MSLLQEYGRLALFIYLGIFAVTLAGFWVAIQAGFRPSGVTGNLGTLAASWLATKVTQPLRIGATLAITPVVGAWRKRRAKGPGETGQGATLPAPAESPGTTASPGRDDSLKP